MPLPRQKRLKVLAQLLIRLRQRKQFVRQKRHQKIVLNLPTKSLDQAEQVFKLDDEIERPRLMVSLCLNSTQWFEQIESFWILIKNFAKKS